MKLDELINVTANGLEIASFKNIRDTLIEWYKSKFGSDIDLDTGTADGVFVYDLAILLNNAYDAISSFEHQMHIDSATGSNLDSLVRLSNIFRKQATNSTASLQVTNLLSQQVTESNMTFLAADGTEWLADEVSITFAANETKVVNVHCTTPGRILAPAGTIKQIQINSFSVSQPEDAIPGRNTETDEELKLRFSQTQGANSRTTLEGLRASLLTISGIKDVKIYNNNSGSTQIMKDTTNVSAHDVYIIIRKDESVSIDDSIIGKRIHSLMTSGIKTAVMATGTTGNAKTYVYLDDIYGSLIQEASENVNWKEALPVSPEIVVNLLKKDNYTSDVEQTISNAVCKYMNALPIDTDIPDVNAITNVVRLAIPSYKGRPKAEILNVTIGGGTSYVIPNTYYGYNSIIVNATELKTTIINGNYYNYLPTMTWADWIDSDYNEVNATSDTNGHVFVGTARVKSFGTEVPIEETDLMSAYPHYVYSTAQLGFFQIGDYYSRTFEIGQDFDTWIGTSYNPFDVGAGRLFKDSGKLAIYIVTTKLYLHDGTGYVGPDDLIIANKKYQLSI